jgi:hypothetical protein
VGEVQGTEEERIALAIEGRGEFLSEELKKLLREIEVVQGLRAGALGKEIEARLRGVTEPSVEKLKGALREEIDKLEERFHIRKRKDNAGGRLEDCTMVEPGEDPGGTPKPAEAPDGGGPEGRGGIYVPEVDNTLKVLPAPETKGLRSQENEVAQQFKFVEDLCAELELAVLGGNIRKVKCQRRALTSGLRQAEEAIVRTAEAHRWTKDALDRALDDVRGRALPHKEEADHFLQAEEQEKRSKWIFECQKMAQNAINLASQATRALTIGDWSYQDCEEFLDDFEKEFKKVNKELDIHSPMDCEPGVKRKMADCRLRLEAAQIRGRKGRHETAQRPRGLGPGVPRRQAEGEGTRYQDGTPKSKSGRQPCRESPAGSLRKPVAGKERRRNRGARGRQAQVFQRHPRGKARHEHTHGIRQRAEAE